MSGPNLAGGVFSSGGGTQTLAPVAYSGEYADLIGKPNLGSAAEQDVSAFASAGQGALASTALQPGAQIPWSDVTGKPSIGTVTSVGMTAPTGFNVSGSPVTGSGVFTINYATGYQGYTVAEAEKLAGVAPGATANQTNTYLLARANHTGTQLAATISDFSTAADARISAAVGSSVQAYSAKLGALAGQTWAADQITYQTGTGSVANTSLTAFGRSLIDDANASTARTTLGLAIGTDVQAYSSLLASVAALTLSGNAGKAIVVNAGATGFELATAGGGSVVNSIQSGYVNSTSLSTGSGQDEKYIDVTISAVDITKASVTFSGVANTGSSYVGTYFISTTVYGILATARLTSTTNLRISVRNTASATASIIGRWEIVEYA